MATARRRSPGLRIHPERVRQARHEAGLSLAQLARGDISRTALHLVETGKSRPTIETLTLIAERTGRPIEFFLDGEQTGAARQERAARPEVDELELATAQGRFDDAKAIAETLLKAVTEPSLRARICLLAAQAHLQTASVEPALPLLAEARAVFEAAGDKWMLVECIDWQAAAEHLLENPRALTTARQALALATTLRPAPARTLVRIYGRIGAISVAQHRWRDAIDAYEAAVEAGAGLAEMSRLAKMHNDLSIAYRRIGRLAPASEHARKAIAIHEVLNDRLSIGRAETNLALVLMRRGDYSSAGQHLDRALQIFIEAEQKRGRAHILLAQAELLRDTGDLAGGRTKAEEAAQLTRELGEDATAAEAAEILATIEAASGDVASADRLFGEAIHALERLKLADRLTSTHAVYARILEARGDVTGALKQWRLAVAATHPEAALDLPASLVSDAGAETA